MFELEPFDPFLEEGLITEIIRPIKSGKEASVYLCRAGDPGRAALGTDLLACKVYRPREQRNFKDDSMYRAGRVIVDQRIRRAVANKSAFGRQAGHGGWVHHEYETLKALAEAGADVPRVVRLSDSAILMEYVGDEGGPAPQLRHVRLEPAEAREVFDRLLWNVELALAHNVVHADLSPFNVLWWEGRSSIIDWPQAIDPRSNPNADSLLARDVANLCSFFCKQGVDREPERLTQDLWMRFIFAEL